MLEGRVSPVRAGWHGVGESDLAKRSCPGGAAGLPPEIAQQLTWVFRLTNRRRKGRGYAAARRLADLVAVVLTAPLWLALLAVCCLLVKMGSPMDPVLFVQQRTGRNGRRFPMFKIRTMVRDAEQLLPALAHLNQRQWPEIKLENDPRITAIGRVLRRSHLDELPQLFNVLRGEMALVGPRPTSAPVEVYEPWQYARLAVLPGITGLWQVLQDDVNDFTTHIRLDIIYAEASGWRLDLAILLRTARRMVAGWTSPRR